jgi:hypothetical protein
MAKGKNNGPKVVQPKKTRERVMVLQASGKRTFIWRNING